MYRNSKYIQDLTEKEKHMINKIMKKYDLNVEDICKNRSVYKLKTEKGNICLKKINHDKYKAVNGLNLVNILHEKNFIFTPKYIKTTEDNLLVKYKNIYFYATEWIDGQECDMSNMEDTLESIKLLAKFHIVCKNINSKELKLKNNLKDWPKDFNKNLYDLEKFKNFIQHKKLKCEFDTKYYEHMNNFYSRALTALDILNSSNYYKICSEVNKYSTICHNSFYYQNVIKKDGEYYLIDLNSIMIDLQITDLGKFIRRLMFKKDYKWDFNKAKSIIEEYNSINKLSKDELEIMLSLIIFPHKFWKLGKKRYIKHKNWSETRYMHKLEKIIEYDDLQQKFMQDYLEYINNYKG